MSTVEEKRAALLKVAGWDPDYWLKDPALDITQFRQREKWAAIVFPDEPEVPLKAGGAQTFHVNQRFAEGFDPDRVAKAFAAAVETAAQKQLHGVTMITRSKDEWDALTERIQTLTYRAILEHLEAQGKNKAVKVLHLTYRGPGSGL